MKLRGESFVFSVEWTGKPRWYVVLKNAGGISP